MPIIRTRIKVSEGSSTFIDTTLTQAVDEYSKEKFELSATEGDLTPRNIDTIEHFYIKGANSTDTSYDVLFAASGTAITVNANHFMLLTQTSEAVVLANTSISTNVTVSAGGT